MITLWVISILTDPEFPFILSASTWLHNVLILPGNCVEFSLETASLYAQDPHNNRYGFKCLVVGYDNPTSVSLGPTPKIKLPSLSKPCFSLSLRSMPATRV